MMKPNDKAIEAARKVVIQRATHNIFNPSFLFGVIEAALDAAYAAQFHIEDYAGLIEELRLFGEGKAINEAADALEALLAERDELKGVIQSYQILLETQQGMFVAVQAERDALLAHLAPVDDDILREIAAMHFARIDGHSDNWDRYVDEAKDYIDAIRPHIEAVERERCAKIAETPDLWVTDKPTRGCDDIAAAIRRGK